MIFAHIIVGMMPVYNNQFSWFWFLGSIAPDIDHLLVLARHKIFSWNKIVDTMKFEDKYNLKYKTKYIHSIFGAAALSLPIALLDSYGAFYFFAAYVMHLFLDWPDRDEKQYLFPIKTKFRGFLPIFSKPEKIFTAALIAIYFFISFVPASAATLKNAGFIQGNIWYSEDPFYVGDTIRIYSAIFNNSGSDLIGTVEFYDNAEKIGSSNFSAINGRLVEVWTDWTVTPGKHKIYAKIVDAQIAKVGGGYEAVDLPTILTGNSEKSALLKPEEVKKIVEKIEAEKAATENSATGASSNPVVSVIADQIKNAAAAAEKTIEAINNAADALNLKIGLKKADLQTDIDILSGSGLAVGGSVPETAVAQFERPLKYLYLASLNALGYVLEYKILLYGILTLTLIKIIKH